MSRPIIDIAAMTVEIADIVSEPPSTGYAQRHDYDAAFTVYLGIKRHDTDLDYADVAAAIVALLEGRSQAEIAQIIYDTTVAKLGPSYAPDDDQGVLL